MKSLKTTLLLCLTFTAIVLSFSPAISQTSKLTDAEIASIAVVANQSDIDFAAIAKEKSKNQEVLKFAETMARDHKAVIEQAVALVTKLKVTPKDNAISKKMKADAEKTKKQLRATSAKNFDIAYINNEVEYHKNVINAVQNVLIPQASNAELKSLLQNVLQALKAHLQHAEMVQKSLKH